ncbi:MAG TPA: oligopeptide/dipeptide ABC transporter ATP-binding protein [Thermodesulfobacteriota bacterium]|nr:oligopeptide/dipeptide ABC transporter ATP-binding protein [Thermodesulfobacteriota bacterium]
MSELLLKTQDLSKYFFSRKWKLPSLKPRVVTVKAVDRCSLELKRGDVLAVVGESGSGKTTLGQSIARIIDPTGGRVWFSGREITGVKGQELKALRREIQMVFQDPGSSLNPRHRIDDIVALPLKIHLNISSGERKERVRELLNLVQLPVELMPRYPHALSGGQKQRVGIARALALNPQLVILDEPTSSLDVSVQAKILHLLKGLRNQLGLTYLLITHNLSIVKNFSEKIIVMYLGRIVEMASTETLFSNPLHPYTRALLSATPVITEEEKKHIPAEITLEGEIPSPVNVPRTCAFLSRCQEKSLTCAERENPELEEVEGGHWVRCPYSFKSPGQKSETHMISRGGGKIQ